MERYGIRLRLNILSSIGRRGERESVRMFMIYLFLIRGYHLHFINLSRFKVMKGLFLRA